MTLNGKSTLVTGIGRATAEGLGRAGMHVLVDNAGAFAFAPSNQTDEGAYEEMMAVNVRAPSFLTPVPTPGTAVIGELLEQVAARLPAKRVADAAEIAAAVVYLAWTFLSDAGRKVQRDLEIQEYTDPHHDPMIPHALVLEPGLTVYSIYNGYWPTTRPRRERSR